MTARTIAGGGVLWRFAPDEPPPLAAERSQVMLEARLVDEVLAAPPQAPATVRTTVLGAVARAAGGGRVGVVGRPAQAFFAPAIALARMTLSAEAAGFLPLRLEAPVGAQPGYPAAFAAVDLGDVALHRAATRLSGRVASRATGPIAGATVAVSGVWPVLQHPLGPAQAATAMPAPAGLYADRPAGGTLRRRNLTPAALVKTLLRPAVAGETRVRLSDRAGIVPGQILALAFDDGARVEFVAIAAIDTGSSPDQPAEVTLALPLRRPHLAGTAAARAVPGAAGPANAIARSARSGDVTLWTAALAGIGAATTAIEVAGGPAPAEFHASELYRATTGPGGDYALPPIHRVAALRLTVTPPGPPLGERIVALDWNAPDQTEDFLFA